MVLFFKFENLQLSAKSQSAWKHNRPLVQAKGNRINMYTQRKPAKCFESFSIDWRVKWEGRLL